MRKIAIVPAVHAPDSAEPVAPIVGSPLSAIPILPMLAVVAMLWWAQAVLIPIVFGLLISYALEPLVNRIESWRCPRMVAVPFVLATLLLLLGAGVYGLRGEAVAFAGRLPEAARAIAQAVRTQTAGPSGPFAKLQQAVKELETIAVATRQARTGDSVTAVRIEEPTFRWNAWLWQGWQGALTLAAQLFSVVCLVYCFLASGDHYKRKLVRIVGPAMSDKKLTVQILAEIDRQIERFLAGRAVISAVVGVAVWLTFTLFGLEEAGVWAVLAAVLFSIPIVGPLVIIVCAGIAALLQTGTIGIALAVAGTCAVIAALEGNVLAPLLMSRVGAMNPVAVFISLMFWGWLWGAWGLILAVPITAAAKAICERVDGLGRYAELLKA